MIKRIQIANVKSHVNSAIDDLGMINIFMGKNNVGKTVLHEVFKPGEIDKDFTSSMPRVADKRFLNQRGKKIDNGSINLTYNLMANSSIVAK